MFTHSIVWYKACPYVSTYEDDTQTATLPFPSAICQLRRLSGIRNNYEDKERHTHKAVWTYNWGGQRRKLLKTLRHMTNSRQHSPSGEARSCSTRQAIIHLFINSFSSYVTENTLLQAKEIPAVYTKEGTTQAGTTLHKFQFQAWHPLCTVLFSVNKW